MSGLVGVWNLSGQPADPVIVTPMAAAIAHRGRDHFGIWSGASACLACQLLRVTPESLGERQPVTDDAGNVLLFDGRLDNRHELLDSLPTARCMADSPDSELALAAWREWDEASFAKLQGDFALAVFDSRRQILVLARDPVGCRPLYYWANEHSLVFASEIKAILVHPDVRAKPNRDLIADLLLREQLPYEDDGESYFEDIRVVLPGYLVSITPRRTRSERFWDFDPLARVRYRSYAEYAEHLRGLLIQAVKRRVRSAHPIAVSHSGGLDSSIVLCIAEDLRRAGAFDGPLLPASYAPTEDPSTEENRFISLLESERGLLVRRLALGAAGDAAQLRCAAWHSETPMFNCSWCSETPLLAYANAQGARVLLTGLWSDQLFFGMGYLVDLFRRLAWREIARHLEEYRNWFVDVDASYFRAGFSREMLLNLTPAAIRSCLRPFRTTVVTHDHSLVSLDLASRVRRRRPRIVHPEYSTAHARNVYQTVRAKSRRLQFEADEKIASRYEIERVTPFLDRDVIAYLMSIPGDIQTHNGVPRALLRDAMRGITPDAILRRRWADEGTTSVELERTQRKAYVAAETQLHACKDLGFCSDLRPVSLDSLEFLGLEFWSRTFFSDRLGRPL